ncbi:MAG: hypothetical protein R3223_07730 [Longimicrobiales bacterium]|nr:hypothetical protein [Longimicrobiales bacterium]
MATNQDQKQQEGFREGIRQGLGILSALKEAIEDTINEARERGDLSAERARDIARDTVKRAQEVAGQARERLDLVHQQELDALGEQIQQLRSEVEALTNRVARLEESPGGDSARDDSGFAGGGGEPGRESGGA